MQTEAMSVASDGSVLEIFIMGEIVHTGKRVND